MLLNKVSCCTLQAVGHNSLFGVDANELYDEVVSVAKTGLMVNVINSFAQSVMLERTAAL